MKIFLSTLSMITLTTSIGIVSPILNNQIKTININDNEPKNYDGQDKIINSWADDPQTPPSFVYIKSSTFNTWFKLFSLHDSEKLREKVYYDILKFPFYGNGWPKPNIYKLSELIINNFASLLNIRGHNTYGIKLYYQFGILMKTNPQFSPNSNDKNILEKYYKFFTGDTLKVGISRYQWEKILKTNKNKNEIFNIISQFPEWDCSGWKGYISNEDLYTLAGKIIDSFNTLKIRFENSCSGWKVATNTTGSWLAIQKEY